MRHMTLNVVVLALVYAGLSLATPEPEPDLGVCEQDVPTTPDYSAGCDRKAPVGFNAMVELAATEYGVDPKILATTVYRESDCNSNAVGSSGEIGLGQIHPKVWLQTLRAAGIVNAASDLYDPLTNLRATAYVLNVLGGRTFNLHDLFRRYNGSGRKARLYADAQVAAYHKTWGED